ncbi:MAG: hypothetical protein ACQEUT_18265 [Bacillota bacterium]
MKMFYEVEVNEVITVKFVCEGGATVKVYHNDMEMDCYTDYMIQEKGYSYFAARCENYVIIHREAELL